MKGRGNIALRTGSDCESMTLKQIVRVTCGVFEQEGQRKSMIHVPKILNLNWITYSKKDQSTAHSGGPQPLLHFAPPPKKKHNVEKNRYHALAKFSGRSLRKEMFRILM